MKNYSDKQKYLMIFWYHFLKDVKEYNIEDALDREFPGYKIDWGAMSKLFSWASGSVYARKRVYPWPLKTINSKGRKLRVVFEFLIKPIDI